MSDHPQILPIYYIETEWLRLTPSIVFISRDHPNNRVWGIVTDPYHLLRLPDVEI